MSDAYESVELKSYDPVVVTLEEGETPQEEGERAAYIRALAAIELSKRVQGVGNPHVYESAAEGLKAQAVAQAKASGTSLEEALAKQHVTLAQYDRMVRMQAADMVNQGLALDAWARHFGVEPTEDDVMELLETMSHGKPARLLEQIGQDAAQLEALSLAAMRYAANKHLAMQAVIA